MAVPMALQLGDVRCGQFAWGDVRDRGQSTHTGPQWPFCCVAGGLLCGWDAVLTPTKTLQWNLRRLSFADITPVQTYSARGLWIYIEVSDKWARVHSTHAPARHNTPRCPSLPC